jgi:type III secretion protein F
MTVSSSPLSFNSLSTNMISAMQSVESNLQQSLAAAASNPDTITMLQVQQQVQQWSLMSSIQSTVIKEVSDAMKAAIQKAG